MGLTPSLEIGATFDGPSKTLNDTHFSLFSGITGDTHPIHYDIEYAKQTRFGRPVAHGLLLASLTALGASTARTQIDGLVLVEQSCRYLKPAMIGDTIRPRLILEKIWKQGHRTFYRFGTRLLNHRGETLLEGFHVYRALEDDGNLQPKVEIKTTDREKVTAGKDWPSHLTYAPALRVGNTIWLSGTTGTDDEGKITAPGDIVEQTRQIFRKFERLLQSVGGSCEDIVQTHDFFTTTENYKGTAAVRGEFFKTSQPTSAGVLVAGLLRKNALIEISAVAVLRNPPAGTRTE